MARPPRTACALTPAALYHLIVDSGDKRAEAIRRLDERGPDISLP